MDGYRVAGSDRAAFVGPAGPRARSLAVALALVASLTGCGFGSGDRTTVRVLAAASLTDVFEELATSFEETHTSADVELSFGSSTDLAQQVADGAPGDVLATADEASMALAEDAGVVNDPILFATNELVIVTPPDNPARVDSLADLDHATWVRCADEAPCGQVAAALLDTHHVDAAPASFEEDVRATLDKVTSGEADAGLVYASDAVAAGSGVTTVTIPGAAEQQTSYVVATLDQAADADLARAWTALVTGDRGRELLEAAGFTLP